MSAKKACRVNWPSPKLRREFGVQRVTERIVPVSNPQAYRANACGSWAFWRSRKWRKEFGPERTGAGEGIRTLDPNLGKVSTSYCNDRKLSATVRIISLNQEFSVATRCNRLLRSAPVW